jgi:hypothetical protein
MTDLIKKLGEADIRIRVNWRGKLILQVSHDVLVNYDPRTDNHKPKYRTVWRDACVSDLFTGSAWAGARAIAASIRKLKEQSK